MFANQAKGWCQLEVEWGYRGLGLDWLAFSEMLVCRVMVLQ